MNKISKRSKINPSNSQSKGVFNQVKRSKSPNRDNCDSRINNQYPDNKAQSQVKTMIPSMSQQFSRTIKNQCQGSLWRLKPVQSRQFYRNNDSKSSHNYLRTSQKKFGNLEQEATIKEVLLENQRLRKKLQEFLLENLQIQEENTQLKYQINSILTELGGFMDNKNSIQKEFAFENNLEKIKSSEKLADYFIKPKEQRILSHSNNLQQSKSSSFLFNHYRILSQSLESENKMLYQIKSTLVENLKASEKVIKQRQKTIEILDNQNNNLIQKNKQGLDQYLELEKHCVELQENIQKINQQIVILKKHNQQKETQHEEIHAKFHYQIERLKEKIQKYKLKAEQYRGQRDQLAIEIQKAKLQLKGITPRQYFPEFRNINRL